MAEALAERLTGIISGADSEINLPEAALLVASHRYPDLDVQHYLGELDTLGETLRQRIDPSTSEPERILALNQFLFGDLGFAPNADDYYDPRNSFLNEVIDRRVGIPITLSLVYMEVGKRIGLPLQGVCFPGHFLVKCKVTDGLAILDPYSGGTSLGIVDLQRRLREVRGGEVSRAIIAGLLVASSNKEILLRVLRNLKAIYLRSHQLEHALAVMEWIVRAARDQPVEVRDRGMVYQELDCFRAAIADFDLYLELDPECTDADDIRQRLIRLQQASARLN